MKSNDLMIGDWVQNPHGLKGRVRSIKYIPKDNADNYGGYSLLELVFSESTQTFPINDAKPIPLTPEILEKNGFDINGIPEDMVPVEERDWSDDTYVWSRQETPDEVMEVYVYMDDLYNFFVEIICQYCHVDGVHIKYVHELQHALRLCGIDKTIEL